VIGHLALENAKMKITNPQIYLFIVSEIDEFLDFNFGEEISFSNFLKISAKKQFDCTTMQF